MAKQLIPIANRPILGYVLDQIARSNIEEVGVIIAPDTGEDVKRYVKDGSEWGLKVTFILQEPLGLAHSVKTAEKFLGGDDFVMYLGDNLVGTGIKGFMEKFERKKLDALVLLKEVEDPTKFGVAVLDENGRIKKVVEKPKVPPSNLALVGVYFFSAKIHQVIAGLKPSWRGELEITDAIQEMVARGFNVCAEILNTWWLDTGKKDDVLAANSRILEYLECDIRGELVNTEREGPVVVGEGSKIIDSFLRGPCVIGKNCLINGSVIGPNTSVGDETHIVKSSVQNCVLLERVRVDNVGRLEDSLVGKFSRISGRNGSKTLKLHIGDYCEVEI